jgi:ethanolamine ammonia-lyase small subunit
MTRPWMAARGQRRRHRVDGPAVEEVWPSLRTVTSARIGLGRAGDALPTAARLELRAAHAQARDAVNSALDVDALAREVGLLGLGEPRVVASAVRDRREYLTRPDLGRLPGASVETLLRHETAEVAVVLADGLSPSSLRDHAPGFLRALADGLGASHPLFAPVIALNARVALGDHIGQALGARIVIVVIGERPGLSVTSSLGAYLTFEPRPGRTDAERNCVSNIHPPDGLGYAQAAGILRGLVDGSVALGASGVVLKDRSGALGP